MTRPLTSASDRVVGVRWWTVATAFFMALPGLCVNAKGDEYGRPVYSANPGVYQTPQYGSPAAPAQQIPAYSTPSAMQGMQQATFTVNQASPNAPVLRAYPCTPAQGAVLDASLNEQFGSLGGVRIVHDHRTNQVLVMAPEAIQQQIVAQVRALSSVSSQNPPQLAPAQSATPAPTPSMGPSLRREYQLRHLTAGRLESILATALGTRWNQVPQAAGAPSAYRLAVAGQPSLGLWLDPSRNRLLLEGPSGRSYDSCARLIESLDTPRRPEDGTRCLVSLTNMTTGDLAETIHAIHRSNGPAVPRRSTIGPANILLAQAQTPIAQPGSPDDREEVTAAVPMPGATEGTGGGTSLVGSVQIESLEGLDVLVIKGDKRDVQQVVDLINRIQAMTIKTKPKVVVHPLTHVNCEALATLVTSLYSEVFSTRHGDVSITALVKPNALLLIGREESVTTVLELVDQLDQPVPPETQFQVFRLRHAAAATAQETIETFFQDSEGNQLAGLGQRVRVLSDYRSNSLIVRASPRDMLEVSRMITEIDTPDVTAVNDLRVFKLKNSLAEDLQPILQEAINGQGSQQNRNQQNTEDKSIGLRFVTIDSAGQRLLSSGILTDVRVTADSRANALLVSAPADSMPLIEALINQLDQLPAAQAQLKVFTIVNGDAAALVEMLESLFGQTTNQTEPPVRTGATEGDSSLVTLRFATDVRTNSIITSGAVGDLAVVEAILLRLDESEVKERKTVVYRLKNSPAEEVAAAINEYLEDERDVRQDQDGLFSTFEIFEKEVIVVPETVSNTLIVSATPEYYDEIADLVEQLDQRNDMVMIQVLIAEVQLNDTEEFGIELGLQDSILFDRSLLGDISTITNSTQTTTASGVTTVTEEIITSATNEPGFLFNDVTSSLGNSGASNALTNASVIGTQGLSNFAVGRINNELGYGGLVMSASSESVSMLLRALKEERRINILSRPQIMTMDNQGANIQVGERVPRVTGTSTNESGGITNQVTMEDVGLIVGVTPRISPDGLVVMEIDAEKSEVGPEADGIPISVSEGVTIRSPRIETITTQTTVSALDGQTVVLGGLITSNKTQVKRRVPWLSDIPVLGHLFRYDGFSGKRSELLIVLTPRIVKNEQDAEAILQAEAARMNWCLNDVLELHEDVALRPRDGEWADDETTTIYPDGKAPADGQEFQPLDDVPLPPPAAPSTPTPPPVETTPPDMTNGAGLPDPSEAARTGRSGYVAPANYESRSRSSGVYPATGSLYPSTSSYPSTSGY